MLEWILWLTMGLCSLYSSSQDENIRRHTSKRQFITQKLHLFLDTLYLLQLFLISIMTNKCPNIWIVAELKKYKMHQIYNFFYLMLSKQCYLVFIFGSIAICNFFAKKIFGWCITNLVEREKLFRIFFVLTCHRISKNV